MLGTSSSSSSCASFGSFEDVSVKASSTVKFLCSYGGKILPRYPDGKLRYVGGETRVLAVDRSVPYSELQVKLGELCGWGVVNLRCQLPTEDLDALVSITSDEDLANLIEEYDLASRYRLLPLKIRAFLHPSPSKSKRQSPTKANSSARPPMPLAVANRCVHHQISVPARLSGRTAVGHHHHRFHAPGSHRHQQYLVHHGNHWQ